MAKTLIIKDADFAANKLATVVFDYIPCTGISVSPSTVSATSADPVTITATRTPVNTTEALSWSSSNESVVTVTNGVLTIVGNGTATVTATCGNQTATVSVSVNIEPQGISVKWEWATTGPSTIGENTATTYSEPSSASAGKYITAFGYGDSATEHELAPESAFRATSPYAIKLPGGTTKVKVDATDKTKFYSGTGGRIIWAKDENSGQSGMTTAIKAVQRDNFDCSSIPVEYSVPNGADSFVLTLRFTSSQSSYGTADALAEAIGIEIEFLTE